MAKSVEDFERWVCGQLPILLPTTLTDTAARYLPQDVADGLIDENGASLVTLDMPQVWYPGGTNQIQQYPAIEAAVPEDDITDFTIGQTDATVETQLIVQCWVRHAKWEVLNAMMKRYTAAVFDALRDPITLPEHEILRARRAWGTNPETPENDDRIVAGGLLVLTLNGAWTRV